MSLFTTPFRFYHGKTQLNSVKELYMLAFWFEGKPFFLTELLINEI